MAKREIIKRVELRFYDGDEMLVDWLESQGNNATAAIKRALTNEMNGLEASSVDYGRIRAIMTEELAKIGTLKSVEPAKKVDKEKAALLGQFTQYNTFE